MKRTLVTAVPALKEDHRQAIRAAAERNGFEALFFDTDAAAKQAAERAEVMLTASPSLAENAPALRWLCTPFAGADRFAQMAVFLSGRAVLTNSSGAYGVTIAEHAVMVTLEMLRRQSAYSGIVEKRMWKRDLPVRAIHGSRITLLGAGDIGRETARRLRPFCPACLTGVNQSGLDRDGLFDRMAKKEALCRVLPETDILIVSLPGTPATFHLLNAESLALLPDGALTVNVGRGSVIDQSALEKELRAGRLATALDVFEKEPLPPDDPLWDCPNLLITPHCAGNLTLPYTVDRIVGLFLENFDLYCAGRPLLRRVDPGKGY